LVLWGGIGWYRVNQKASKIKPKSVDKRSLILGHAEEELGKILEKKKVNA